MQPKELDTIFGLLLGKTSLQIKPVDKTFVMQNMIPDDPEMLFNFAKNFIDSSDSADAEVLQRTLERADDLLDDVSPSHREEVILKGNVKIALGEFSDGIEWLELAIRSNPGDHVTRYRLVETLIQQQDFETAQMHTKKLIETNERPKYRTIHRRVIEEIEKKKAAAMNR